MAEPIERPIRWLLQVINHISISRSLIYEYLSLSTKFIYDSKTKGIIHVHNVKPNLVSNRQRKEKIKSCEFSTGIKFTVSYSSELYRLILWVVTCIWTH
jgi:tRNA G37 N-methylase Trm5